MRIGGGGGGVSVLLSAASRIEFRKQTLAKYSLLVNATSWEFGAIEFVRENIVQCSVLTEKINNINYADREG